MKKLSPSEAGIQAAKWLDDELQKQLSNESVPTRKQLYKTLYARQKKAVSCLNLVRTQTVAPKDKPAVSEQEKWMQILLHPAANLLLPVVILVLAIFKLHIVCAIVSVLMLVRAVLMLLFKPRNAPEEPEAAFPYVDDNDLDNFLRDQRSIISLDVNSIMNQASAVDIKEHKGVMNDVISVYTALYEAKVDEPENKSLSYPLSVLTTCMHRSGLDVVHYTPENAALFEVLDVDYPSTERIPALRNRENGVIVKKGLYLNETK